MDIPYLKSEFLNVKDFFYFLYSHNPRQNSDRIFRASDRELDVLIKFLHLVCNGHITLKQHNFDALLNSRRMNAMQKHFQSTKSFLNTLDSEREEKISILRKFVTLYPNLFYTTFNLT